MIIETIKAGRQNTSSFLFILRAKKSQAKKAENLTPIILVSGQRIHFFFAHILLL